MTSGKKKTKVHIPRYKSGPKPYEPKKIIPPKPKVEPESPIISEPLDGEILDVPKPPKPKRKDFAWKISGAVGAVIIAGLILTILSYPDFIQQDPITGFYCFEWTCSEPRDPPKVMPDIDPYFTNYTDAHTLFNLYAHEGDVLPDGQINRLDAELQPGLEFLYDEIKNIDNKTIVLFPELTLSAYASGGFSSFFAESCESCLRTEFVSDMELANYHSSNMAYEVLTALGYDSIPDTDVDKDPDILKQYDKVILLHNEYVTKEIFDAVMAHPNVIYLYPNSLRAEIGVDYVGRQIELLRGNGHPREFIQNGFDWKYDTSEYRSDTTCATWEFIDAGNGYALNCYPENAIAYAPFILKALRESNSTYWRHATTYDNDPDALPEGIREDFLAFSDVVTKFKQKNGLIPPDEVTSDDTIEIPIDMSALEDAGDGTIEIPIDMSTIEDESVDTQEISVDVSGIEEVLDDTQEIPEDVSSREGDSTDPIPPEIPPEDTGEGPPAPVEGPSNTEDDP